ncbi:hypothetical protein ABK040_008352 [Willaertia magna]
MLRKRKNNKRFNLLLLKEDETYFQDFSCTYFVGTSGREKYKGRLHFCSHSLVFVPDDIRYAITRHCFDKIEGFQRFRPSSMSLPFFQQMNDENLFSFTCTEFVDMKKGNKDHPYIFRKQSETIVIGLTFVTTNQFMEKVLPIYQLFVGTSSGKQDLPTPEVMNQIYEDQIAKGFNFDITWLEDFREQTLYETHGVKVKPLVDINGCILLTNERIYFQPFNNISTKPVKKYNLKDICRLVKRRHNLRQIGIEIFLQNSKSIFFAFRNQLERDNFFTTILKQPTLINISMNDQGNMTLKWQNGLISNFDYLLYLNFIADRSFNDLTQYPVFPWVIADYTSKQLDLNNPKTFRDLTKPIGALNSDRLSYFKDRFNQMPDPKFLYGTHYSTPGYVLYYLVRQAPEYMLKLQNGKFDAADREFHSMKQTFHSVLNNTTDLKELIPEFYQSTGNFLTNSLNLDLGIKNNGERVNNVVLPPWAKDERDFIYKCRLALESEYVSKNLHHWIDLIFGYKQRGIEAVKSDNVFYYLTYEGAVDIEKIKDPIERRGIEIQIREFGQTPKQVFTVPHPQRKSNTDTSSISLMSVTSSDIIPLDIISATSSSSVTGNRGSISSPIDRNRIGSSSSLFDTSSPLSSSNSGSFSSLYKSTSSPTMKSNKNEAFDINDLLKTDLNRPSSFVFNSKDQLGTTSGGEDSGDDFGSQYDSDSVMGLDNLVVDSPTKVRKKRSTLRKSKLSTSQSAMIGEDDDNNNGLITKYNTLNGVDPKPTIRIELHRDRIGSAIISKDKTKVYTSSDDSTCKIYSLESKRQLRRIADMGDMSLSSCLVIDDPVTDQKILIVGSWDNKVYIYSIEYGKVLSVLQSHEDAISKVCFKENTLYSASWDSTVKLWKCNSGSDFNDTPFLTLQDHDSPVHSLSVDSTNTIVASGAEDGNVILYDVRQKKSIAEFFAHSDIVTDLSFIDGQLITCSKDSTIKIFDMSGSEISKFKGQYTSWRCLSTDGFELLTGGEDGKIYKWNVAEGNLTKVVQVHSSAMTCMNISQDGESIVCGSKSGELVYFEK